MTNEQQKEQEVDFIELPPEDAKNVKFENCDILKSFFCRDRKGPGRPIPAGSIARLTVQTAREAFPARAIPTAIVDGKEYTATRFFRYITAQGLYEDVRPGTVMRLSREEAIYYLARGCVVPRNFECAIFPRVEED
jgi:hypothetical protein